MPLAAVIRDQERVRDRVRDQHAGEKLLSPALAHVLVAASQTGERTLPGPRCHDVEANARGGERHQQAAVASPERERRDGAHLWERVNALDARAHVREPAAGDHAGELEEDVRLRRRHGHTAEPVPVQVDSGDPARRPWIDTDVNHLRPPFLSISRITVNLSRAAG